MKALYRLKDILLKDKIAYTMQGKNCELTLSSCIGEPLPEDDIRQLIQNMEKDLDKHEGQLGAIIEYQEMSPLQRFLSEGQK